MNYNKVMKKLMMIINNAIYNNKIKVIIHNINEIRKNNNLNDNQSVNKSLTEVIDNVSDLNNKINYIIGLFGCIENFEGSITENEREFLSKQISKGDKVYVKYIEFLNHLDFKLKKKLNVKFQYIEKDTFEKLELVKYNLRDALVAMKHIYLLSLKNRRVKYEFFCDL